MEPWPALLAQATLLTLLTLPSPASSSGLAGAADVEYLLEHRVSEGIRSLSVDLRPLLRRKLPDGDLQVWFFKEQRAYPFGLEGERLVLRAGLDREQFCRAGSDCGAAACCRILRLEASAGRLTKDFFIKLIVDDVNDSDPEFVNNLGTKYLSVSEDAQPGEELPLAKAVDADSEANGVGEYQLAGELPANGTFRRHWRLVDSADQAGTPKLRLLARLDRERVPEFSCRLLAVDRGRPARTGTLSVTVQVKDVNDNRPRFEDFRPGLVVRLNESAGRHEKLTVVEFVVADPDAGANGRVSCRLLPAPLADSAGAAASSSLSSSSSSSSSSSAGADAGDGRFSATRLLEVKQLRASAAGRSRWRVSSVGSLDYESVKSFGFLVVAADAGSPSLSATASVSVLLSNVDDNAISIGFWRGGGRRQRVGVDENQPAGLRLASVEVKDADLEEAAEYDRVECRLGEGDGHFRLVPKLSPFAHAKEFDLRTARRLDREENDEHRVVVVCHDRLRPPAASATATLTVTVGDVNDCAPTFSRRTYRGRLAENSPPRSLVVMEPGHRVRAHDRDAYPNDRVTYSLAGRDAAAFSVGAGGDIRSEAPVDFEQQRSFHFNVTAVNDNNSSMRGSAEVVVSIVDLNDNAPVMGDAGAGYGFDVDEELSGVVIGRVNATDADTLPRNKDVEFRLVDGGSGAAGYFHVDARSGDVSVRQRVDAERHRLFQFKVVAENPAPLVPPASGRDEASVAMVTVRVANVNDHPPLLCRAGASACRQPATPLRLRFGDSGVFVGEAVTPAQAKCVVFDFELRDADAWTRAGASAQPPAATVELANVTELVRGRARPAPGVEFVLDGQLLCLRHLPASHRREQIFLFDIRLQDAEAPRRATAYRCRVIVARTTRPPRPPPSDDDGASVDQFADNSFSRRNFVIVVTIATVIVLLFVIVFAFVLFFYVRRYDNSLEKEFEGEPVTVPLQAGTLRKVPVPAAAASPELNSLLRRCRRDSADSCHGNDLEIEQDRRRYEVWRGEQRQPATAASCEAIARGFPDGGGGGDVVPTAAAYQTIDPFAGIRGQPPLSPTQQQLQHQQLQQSASATSTPYQKLRAASPQATVSTSLRTSADQLCSPRKSLKGTYFETSFV